jgi:uncharacterized protein VirK/YbjX
VRKLASSALSVRSDRNVLKIISRCVGEIAAANSPLRAGFFMARALRDSDSARTWLTFLDAFERIHHLPPARAEMVAKPLGNYAIYGLSVSERADILRFHYKLAAMKLPMTVLSRIWSGSSIELGYLHGKRRQSYRLSLTPAGYCHKEGEFGFALSDMADGLELARLTFVLRELNCGTKHVLLIGGLQGPSSHCGPGAKKRIVAATRALYGLRPKMAVFAAARAFAIATGSHGLHAVSNHTHTINADAWYQRRRMHADYDAFWIERGGTPNDSGFDLPIHAAPKARCPRRSELRTRVESLVYYTLDFKSANGHLASLPLVA